MSAAGAEQRDAAMQAFVVAVEYCRTDIGTTAETLGIGVCEHAYDLRSATLAGHSPGAVAKVCLPGPATRLEH